MSLSLRWVLRRLHYLDLHHRSSGTLFHIQWFMSQAWDRQHLRRLTNEKKKICHSPGSQSISR
eukprot:12933317-Prorocentrum_lima.AAC.1